MTTATRNKRPEFTAEQLAAINGSGNTIVSAGAGSGKTTVMIERIIQKLLNGSRLDEMLIVTFTRASAADMRVKLAARLSELKNNGECDIRIAEDAIESMPTCKIGTLHSYCQRLVKTYFYVAGYDPTSPVLDDGEAKMMMQSAVRAAAETARNANDPAFRAVYDMLASRSGDEGFVRAVVKIIEFAMSVSDTRAYLSDITDDGKNKASLKAIRDSEIGAIKARAEELAASLEKEGMLKQLNVLPEFIAHLEDRRVPLPSCPRRSERDNGELSDKLSKLRADCKELSEKLEETERAYAADPSRYVNALLAVARDAYSRYTERKRRASKMDYSDLEHGALRVLSNGDCLAEISRSIRYVFIDEFQDVNPLQSDIADRFRSAGAEMFVVGDVKQSIYGFRCCSPEHFSRVWKGDNGYNKIALNANFRSTETVVDFINEVFDGVMTEDFGGADYKTQRLIYGNKSMTGGSAACLCVSAAQDADKSVEYTPYSVKSAANGDSEDIQAVLIADKLTEWIKQNPDKGLKSAAVLVRSTDSAFVITLKNELLKRGIRFALGKKSALKEFPSAVCLIDILRAADDRKDDVALYTALRSPMGGFSDSELAELAADGEKRARAMGIEPDMSNGTYPFTQKVAFYRGRLSDRLKAFFGLRDDITEFSYNHDCAEVLGYITSRINYFQYVYESGGSARAVEALIECAADRRCDAHTFLTYCDGAGFSLDIAAEEDAVSIATIHSCKGLEYDFVIVADVSVKFNGRELRERYSVTERGVSLYIPDGEGRAIKSAGRILENIVIPDEQKQEELRLLYVAMTRAKTKLLVVGRGDPTNKSPGSADCMLGFIKKSLRTAATAEPDFGAEEPAPEENGPDAAVMAAVKRRFASAFDYPVSELPVKTCVTALAEREFEESAERVRVLTDDDRAGDKLKRGTAYHRAMELIDFASPDFAAVSGSIDGAELVDPEEIVRAANAVYPLTVGAAFVARERYFIVDLPSELIGAEGGSVLVQGVIDLLIADGEGNAVIVDYKTGDPERLRNGSYAKQLELYAAAVERATPYKVVRKCLYSFVSGEIMDF